MHLNIAIDGPAGAGKSTVAKRIAETLGIRYLDTGAMYRAMALYAGRMGVDAADETSVARILPEADIHVRYTEAGQRVLLSGEDVTDALRTPEISMNASTVSKHPPVRVRLAELQRAVARENDVVMDGREITTYVLPETRHKFFITASPEERARRRYLELLQRGETVTLAAVLNDLVRRDEQDATRAFAPMVIAPDAEVVDTTSRTIDEVVSFVLRRIREKEAEAAGERKDAQGELDAQGKKEA